MRGLNLFAFKGVCLFLSVLLFQPLHIYRGSNRQPVPCGVSVYFGAHTQACLSTFPYTNKTHTQQQETYSYPDDEDELLELSVRIEHSNKGILHFTTVELGLQLAQAILCNKFVVRFTFQHSQVTQKSLKTDCIDQT